MSHIRQLGLLLIASLLAGGCDDGLAGFSDRLATSPTQMVLTLEPQDLYGDLALEAHRVRLDGDALALDTRNWSVGLPASSADSADSKSMKSAQSAKSVGNAGRLVTDVIELNGGAIVSLPTTVSDLTIKLFGSAPPGSRITTWLRHGPTFFQTDGWTDWQELSTFAQGHESAASPPLDLGQDCYVQVRLDLISDSAKVVPAVKELGLSYVRQVERRFEPQLEVSDYKIQRIVRSPIHFDYERPDQKDLVWLRKSCNLDEVIAGKKTEFEQIVALNDWASTRRNIRGEEGDRHLGSTDPYPWNIHKIFDLSGGGKGDAETRGHGDTGTKEEGAVPASRRLGISASSPPVPASPRPRVPASSSPGTVYGHCASYSQLLITALTAMDWPARHVNIEGYRECTHEVVEVWVNSLHKWVYLDPSLGTYYTDRKDQPLGLIQMHHIFVDFFCERGKTLKDYLPRDEALLADKGWQRRQRLDFNDFPAVVHTNDYTYGERAPWDWTEGQGILSAGFLQMTPRNNFNSQPSPPFLRYAYSPEGVNGYPCWTDAKTPLWYDESDGQKHPDGLSRNWYSRTREWDWTLNQASMKLIRTGPRQITVELGNSQPFFKKYLAWVNDREMEIRSPFAWRLHGGENSLRVECVDEFGRSGIPSTVQVELKSAR